MRFGRTTPFLAVPFAPPNPPHNLEPVQFSPEVWRAANGGSTIPLWPYFR
jgi:hypothetical protein